MSYFARYGRLEELSSRAGEVLMTYFARYGGLEELVLRNYSARQERP